jgi:anamorsin
MTTFTVETIAELQDGRLPILYQSLLPGNEVEIEVAVKNLSEELNEASIRQTLTLAGFVEIRAVAMDGQGPRRWNATKPSYAVGAKISLAKKGGASTTALPFLGSDGSELIAEDDLLTEADKAKVCNPVDKDGVILPKRACENCSCGLKEALEADEATKLEQLKSKSEGDGCGNCALGDAFRCAACPYRGLPAFKEGQIVTLADDDLMEAF